MQRTLHGNDAQEYDWLRIQTAPVNAGVFICKARVR
jgi:hypothetical protein